MTVALAERDLWLAGASAVVAAVSLSLAFGLRPPSGTDLSTAPSVASVKQRVGSVKVRPLSTLGWRDVERGLEVHDGDALFVPPGAEATIVFLDGSELSIDERSLVVIEKPRAGPRSVTLRQGSVSGLAGAEGLTLKTPNGDALLDARSEARVELQGTSLQVSLKKGAAQVKGKSGTQQLTTGERVVAGQTEVKKLDAWPVRLDAPEAQAHLMFRGTPPEITFTWSGAVPAEAHLQLARDRLFAFVDVDAPARDGRFVAGACTRGVTWWRIVDANDEPLSEARRVSCVEDIAPVALTPRPGEVVLAPPGSSTGFAWTPLGGVTKYRLEFSAQEDFTEIAAVFHLTGTGARVPLMLDEAQWFWRVRADDDSESTAPSVPLRFRVIHKGIPDAPELLTPQIEVSP